MSSLLAAYDTRREVPKLPGARVGKCVQCARWGLMPPRFRRCGECQSGKIARTRHADVIAALERACVKPPKAKPPKDQRTINGMPLGRSLAMIEAVRRDFPNVRQCDLKPDWQAAWL